MKHLSALNHFFYKYRLRLILGILFIILTNYFRILAPQLTGYVVDSVVQKIETPKSINNQFGRAKKNDILVQLIIKKLETKKFNQKILWCGIVLLLLAIISGVFMFMMRQTI